MRGPDPRHHLPKMHSTLLRTDSLQTPSTTAPRHVWDSKHQSKENLLAKSTLIGPAPFCYHVIVSVLDFLVLVVLAVAALTIYLSLSLSPSSAVVVAKLVVCGEPSLACFMACLWARSLSLQFDGQVCCNSSSQ